MHIIAAYCDKNVSVRSTGIEKETLIAAVIFFSKISAAVNVSSEITDL